jgi:hypothetical protein
MISDIDTKPQNLVKSACSMLLTFIFIAIHYFDYYTDLIVLLTFYQNSEYYYFGFSLAFFTISWIVCGIMFLENFKKRYWVIIWLLHLDYPFIMFTKDEEFKNQRKLGSNLLQSSPQLFITVLYIFYQQNMSPTILLSLTASDLVRSIVSEKSKTKVFYFVNLFRKCPCCLHQVKIM